jgi:hypothetical protein
MTGPRTSQGNFSKCVRELMKVAYGTGLMDVVVGNEADA